MTRKEYIKKRQDLYDVWEYADEIIDKCRKKIDTYTVIQNSLSKQIEDLATAFVESEGRV
jgi:uncharacterized protein Yka (UPF0111/DUF47 family)